MIPQKYYGLVLSAVLSIMMGLLMSGIVTALNTGFDTGYISRWLNAFVIVVPIAFVSILLLGPIARKIAAALTKSESKVDGKISPVVEKQIIWKLFKGTSLILLLHIIEVIVFGGLFWLGANIADVGTIEGASSLKDYMYFSVASYTSQGLGDLNPTGTLRILAGIEALMGLTTIAWTAAFSYKYIADNR
ncbi:MAG: DUF2798 domain-containing protein [Methylococcales bacterium]